ncbi:hypothetical protein GQ53DRAFT_524467 [Thozetella sp. PMI_491]|nr:hypothetical protein GQ53DRAFT_524467 [Thozetella sp. PMI_491]
MPTSATPRCRVAWSERTAGRKLAGAAARTGGGARRRAARFAPRGSAAQKVHTSLGRQAACQSIYLGLTSATGLRGHVSASARTQ